LRDELQRLTAPLAVQSAGSTGQPTMPPSMAQSAAISNTMRSARSNAAVVRSGTPACPANTAFNASFACAGGVGKHAREWRAETHDESEWKQRRAGLRCGMPPCSQSGHLFDYPTTRRRTSVLSLRARPQSLDFHNVPEHASLLTTTR